MDSLAGNGMTLLGFGPLALLARKRQYFRLTCWHERLQSKQKLYKWDNSGFGIFPP